MKNLKEEKLYIQTFREIRSYIITHELKAGDSLPTEQAMCQMLASAATCFGKPSKAWN